MYVIDGRESGDAERLARLMVNFELNRHACDWSSAEAPLWMPEKEREKTFFEWEHPSEIPGAPPSTVTLNPNVGVILYMPGTFKKIQPLISTARLRFDEITRTDFAQNLHQSWSIAAYYEQTPMCTMYAKEKKEYSRNINGPNGIVNSSYEFYKINDEYTLKKSTVENVCTTSETQRLKWFLLPISLFVNNGVRTEYHDDDKYVLGRKIFPYWVSGIVLDYGVLDPQDCGTIHTGVGSAPEKLFMQLMPSWSKCHEILIERVKDSLRIIGSNSKDQVLTYHENSFTLYRYKSPHLPTHSLSRKLSTDFMERTLSESAQKALKDVINCSVCDSPIWGNPYKVRMRSNDIPLITYICPICAANEYSNEYNRNFYGVEPYKHYHSVCNFVDAGGLKTQGESFILNEISSDYPDHLIPFMQTFLDSKVGVFKKVYPSGEKSYLFRVETEKYPVFYLRYFPSDGPFYGNCICESSRRFAPFYGEENPDNDAPVILIPSSFSFNICMLQTIKKENPY